MHEVNETAYSFQQAETVVDLSVILADYTDTIEQCRKIPFIISRAFGVDGVALGIVRPSEEPGPPQFILRAGFGHLPSFSAPEYLDQTLKGVLAQLQPHFSLDPSAACQVFHARQIGNPLQELQDGCYDGFARALAFTREMDAVHRMLLIVYKCASSGGMEKGSFDNLMFLAYELSKQLRGALAWADSPSTLGPPFDSFTPQELRVLSALKSELSEKELARELGLSPHTLHSRIKSIYRKAGVQGRVPLLLRLNAVRRRLRMDVHGAVP